MFARTFFILLVSMLSAAGAPASTLVQEHLSTISEVSVRVLAQRYEPLPGPNPDALEGRLEAEIKATLVKYGIKVNSASPQQLVVSIEYEHPTSPTGLGALLVLTELEEPGVLTRKLHRAQGSEMNLVSWKETYLANVGLKDLSEKLSEAIGIHATDFAQEARQAKHYAEH